MSSSVSFLSTGTLSSSISYSRCLGELFRRKLKLNARPIDDAANVVSPADGTVLSIGKLSGGLIEQVKVMYFLVAKIENI